MREKKPEARSQEPEERAARFFSSFWLVAPGFWLLS
jgi:hypothetical protein